MNRNVKKLYKDLTELNLVKVYLDNFFHELESENDFTKSDKCEFDECDKDVTAFCNFVEKHMTDHYTLNCGPAYILESSFVFKDTPQGVDYWKNVVSRLLDLDYT